MKKLLSYVLICCLVLTAFPVRAASLSGSTVLRPGDSVMIGEDSVIVERVTVLSDGSSVIEAVPKVVMRERGSVTYQKSNYHRDADGNLLWTATLTGAFTYNGLTSSCTDASCSTTIYDSVWHEGAVNAYPSGATAYADVTMVRKFLFITVETVHIVITITCDKDGNLY